MTRPESYLAISTAWNYQPDGDVRQMLSQIRETGIKYLELGYRMTEGHVHEAIPLLDEYDLKVTSIHNFCPIPNDEPSPRHPSNYYRLSSLDEHERKQAVKWTDKTIDLAKKVGAPIVVVHAGTVELRDDYAGKVLELYKKGKYGTDEFRENFALMLTARQNERGPYLDALKKSFADVMKYAYSQNIKIGLETRYYPLEIPNFDEIGFFLNLYHKQGMYYWHDIGHAQVNDILGITPHLKYLQEYKKYLIGMHIHGLKGLRDHQAPFTGDFDFAPIMPFLNNVQYKVIESHANASLLQIKEAAERLAMV